MAELVKARAMDTPDRVLTSNAVIDPSPGKMYASQQQSPLGP